MTRGALSLMLVCFMLPFFTFTLSSCGGSDASQTLEVTGIQLIRQHHGPVENRTDHAPPTGRLNEVPRAAGSGQDQAIAVIAFACVALLGTLMPRRIRGGLSLLAAAGAVWSLFVLAGAVDVIGVDVAYDPGFVFALLLAVGAVTAAAVIPFRDRPLGETTPDLMPAAGFWLRLGAWVLDALLLVAVAVPVVFLVGNATGGSIPPLVTVIAVVLIYRVATETSRTMGTVGQWVVGLQVTRPDGEPLSVGRATLRAVCELCCLVLLLGLGHAAGGLTTGKRTVYDALTGTAVRRRAEEPAGTNVHAEPAPART